MGRPVIPQVVYDPPIPRQFTDDSFQQQISMLDDDRASTISRAIWHASGRDGVVQIIELTVDAAHQRCGHGSTLLEAVFAQSRALFKSRGEGQSLRRIWIPIEQKTQVLGRAFVTGHGFQHVATLSGVLSGQDILIYVRSFD